MAIIGHLEEIFAEGIHGLGGLLLVEQRFGQAESGGHRIGLESQQLAKVRFGRRGLSAGQKRASERKKNGVVLRCEGQRGAILLDGLGTLAAAFEGLSQEIERASLAGQELRRAAKRRRCRGGVGIQQRESQVQMRRSEIRVEGNGAAIFRDGFRVFLQPGIGESKFEMRQRVSRFGRGNFLQQRNGGGEVLTIQRILGLREQWRKGICAQSRSLLWLCWRRRRRGRICWGRGL